MPGSENDVLNKLAITEINRTEAIIGKESEICSATYTALK
jgi:hypothetical protein